MSNTMQESMLMNEQWIRRMAQLEDEHLSVGAGGMVADLGMATSHLVPLGGIFGRFVEFARRKEGLTLAEFAQRAGLELVELVAIEQDCEVKPRVATVEKIARYLQVPTKPLLELAGLLDNRDSAIGTAAIHFAAETENNAALSPHEQAAFDVFIQAIADNTPA